MSKPKKRTMRRLKRTLGITALILALLIAIIPDVGEAKRDGEPQAECKVAWANPTDKTDFDPMNLVGVSISEENEGWIQGGSSNAVNTGEKYRLKLRSLSSGSTGSTVTGSGYETLIYRFTFDPQRVSAEKWNQYISGGGDASQAWDGTVDIFEDPTYASVISDSEYFVFDLNFNFEFKSSKYYYISAYLASNGTWLGGANNQPVPSRGTKASVKASISDEGVNQQNMVIDVYINIRDEADYIADQGTDAFQKTQRDMFERVAIDDQRTHNSVSYTREETYMLGDYELSSESGDPFRAESVGFRKVDRGGVRNMRFPGTGYTLQVTHDDTFDEDAFLAAAQSGNYNLENTSVTPVRSFNKNFIDMVDCFDLQLVDSLGKPVTDSYPAFDDEFNDYMLNICFPSVSADEGPYSYRMLGSDDKFRIAYLTKDGKWYDTDGTRVGEDIKQGYNSPRGSRLSSQWTISKVFDGTTRRVVVYIERGDAKLVPVDNRALEGAAYAAEATIAGKIEDPANPGDYIDVDQTNLISSVFVVVNDLDTYGDKVSSELDKLYKAIDPIYDVYDDEFTLVVSDSETDPDNNATNIFVDGDKWVTSDYAVTAQIALPDGWDYTAEYARVDVYAFDRNTNAWVTAEGGSDAHCFHSDKNSCQMVEFGVRPNYDKEYILIYRVGKGGLGSGTLTGRDKRSNKGTWRGHVSGEDYSIVPSVSGAIPSGTYYLVVKDEENETNTNIYKALPTDEYVTDEYTERAYYDMFIGQSNDTTSISTSKYGAFGTVSLTMSLPYSMEAASADDLIVQTCNPVAGRIWTYKGTDITVKDRSLYFTPKDFNGPLEMAFFYKPSEPEPGPGPEPEPKEGVFTFTDVGCDWMNGVDAILENKSVIPKGDVWTLRFTTPSSSDTSLSMMESLIRRDYSELVKDASFKFFDMKLYLNNSDSPMTDIGANNHITVTVPAPADSFKEGTKLYLWRYQKTSDVPACPLVQISENNNITFTVDRNDLSAFNPYALVIIPSEGGGEGGGTTDTYPVEVDEIGSDLPLDSVTATTTTKGKRWKLVINSVASPNILETLIKGYADAFTNDKTVMDSYEIFLYEKSSDDGWIRVSDIGTSTITVLLPVPSKIRNAMTDADFSAVQVYGYNESSTQGIPSRINAKANSAEGTLQLTIGTKHLANLNPYTLVYTPGAHGSGGEKTTVINMSPFPDAELPSGTHPSDMWSFLSGVPKAEAVDLTIPDGAKLELLVSQYPDDTGSPIGQQIAAKAMGEYVAQPRGENKDTGEPGRPKASAIRAYEIKLKYTDPDGNVSWPKDFSDFGGGSVNITLPYDGNIPIAGDTTKGYYGNVLVYTMQDNSTTPQILSNATKISSRDPGSVTVNVSHFSQYALLYNAYYVEPKQPDPSPSPSSSSASTAKSSGSTGFSGNGSSSGGSSGSTSSGSASNSAGTGSTSGGGGNRAGGDGSGKVDMPKTADATTYKAIFILLLIAFGAFELVSSMPAKRQKVKAQ